MEGLKTTGYAADYPSRSSPPKRVNFLRILLVALRRLKSGDSLAFLYLHSLMVTLLPVATTVDEAAEAHG